MSDFFEPLPEPPPPSAPAVPPWYGAPSGTLPGVIPLELVLARSADAAVCLTRLAAYPTGFELDALTLAHPDSDEMDPLLFGLHGRRRRGELSEGLRLGVQFSTGAKATSAGGAPTESRSEPPEGPVLRGGAGGGGGGNWHQTFWVWPLPPPGPIAFVCQWPAAGIPLTRYEIDAQAIRDAARRALVIFPAGTNDGGFTSSTIHALRPTGAGADE